MKENYRKIHDSWYYRDGKNLLKKARNRVIRRQYRDRNLLQKYRDQE